MFTFYDGDDDDGAGEEQTDIKQEKHCDNNESEMVSRRLAITLIE